ncbi:branched-chain amino acid aminotransferase II, partial [Thelephora terrestris]
KPLPDFSKLAFGENFTDHMLAIPWNNVSGWGTPKIVPYGPLAVDPSSSVLHYAQTLFEGMKAYRDENGRVMLFRPDMNMKRMNTSATRLALPTFNGDELLALIKELLKVDKHWVPQEPGHSLYIRPTLIGTQRALGVSPPKEALLFVICGPVGPYYSDGFKPVSLHGTTEFIRAAPGGTGGYKLGANYGPAVMPQKMANKQGYTQNLWLHGPDHCLTEVGTMNMFVAFKRGETTTLVTPPLDGMILPGVVRDSVLTLARDHASGKRSVPGLPSNLVVEERNVTMAEVKSASQKGELVELFGTGTAAVISPVDRIGYLGEDINIPVGEDGMGPLSRPFWERLMGIQKGQIKSDWTVVVCE